PRATNGIRCRRSDPRGSVVSQRRPAALAASLTFLAFGALFAGSSSAHSVVVPRNHTLPRLSGSAVEGHTLRALRGRWSGRPAHFGYSWQRCRRSGTSCRTVRRGSRASYKLTARDVGRRIRVVVRAWNASGSASAPSALSRTVTSVPPLPP